MILNMPGGLFILAPALDWVVGEVPGSPLLDVPDPVLVAEPVADVFDGAVCVVPFMTTTPELAALTVTVELPVTSVSAGPPTLRVEDPITITEPGVMVYVLEPSVKTSAETLVPEGIGESVSVPPFTMMPDEPTWTVNDVALSVIVAAGPPALRVRDPTTMGEPEVTEYVLEPIVNNATELPAVGAAADVNASLIVVPPMTIGDPDVTV